MKTLDVFQKHQRAIAFDTLRMNDVGVSIMGGMDKPQARNFLRSIGYSENQIATLEHQLTHESRREAARKGGAK